MSAFIQMHIRTAIRSMRRQKWNAVLNIAGLAIGIASSTLILMYVQYELSYDTFHSKADRIYRMYKKDPGNVFLGSEYFSVVPAPLAKAMQDEFPEVEATTMFARAGRSLVKYENNVFMESEIQWAQPSAFTLFDFELLEGNPATALSEPNTVVVSETIARRLFGAENPMGKVIRIQDRYDMQVTGVLKDIPKNSHVGASMFLSFSTYEAERKDNMNWGNSSYRTFLLLREGANPDEIREKLPAFVDRHMGKLFEEWEREATQFFLQPLTDIHLKSAHINFGYGNEGDLNTIYILVALAVVLLATASINYMNLATARATLRAREVGIRKVVGARRAELIRQFIGESLLTTFFSGMIGLAIVEATLPWFSNLVGRQLPASLFSQGGFLPGFLLLLIVVGVVSGSYPAYVLSRYSPVGVLKGISSGRERSRLRDVLVLLQFASSIALAICAFVILSQLEFIRGTDPGYNREQVLAVRIGHMQVQERLGVFKDLVQQVPGVTAMTVSTHLPINIRSSTGLRITGDDGTVVESQCYQLSADEDFLDVYQVPLLAGRFLPEGTLGPEERADEYVVNEAFGRTFGLENPVGKVIERSGRKVTIIGVMKDFHLHSFRQEIAPLLISRGHERWASYLSIRIGPGDISSTVDGIRNAWGSVMQDYPFDFAFVDDSFNSMYERDAKLGTMVSSFTFLALSVAGLGLFGLATFIAETRKKEIGIRKVLGASSSSVAALMSRRFMTLVLLANIVAWPVAYFVMADWLDEFAYRISLGPAMFLLAGIAAAIVALLTVSVQTLRAASANPVESLRYE